jgi:hypothetical protein
VDEWKKFFYKLRPNCGTEERLKKILIDLQTLTESPDRYRDFPALSEKELKVNTIKHP